MRQTPEYIFNLETDRDIYRGVDNTWLQVGVSVTPWQFISNAWKVSGVSIVVDRLYQVMAVPIDSVVEVTFLVTSLFDEIIEVSFLGVGAYTTGQSIVTKFIKGGAGVNIIRAEVNTYANVNQAITITRRPPPGVAIPCDITISGFLAVEVRGNKRVINPGNFKSINYDQDRSPEFWGSVPSLSGALELVGGDWRWVRDILEDIPTRLIFLKLTVTDGVTIISPPPAILDTVTLAATGDGSTYKCVLQLLKDAEWAKLLSYADQKIDTATTASVDSLSVIDGFPVDDLPASPSPGNVITLQQKFFGYAAPSSVISVPADSILFIGFGSRITLNDNFSASKGVTNQETIISEYGAIKTAVGTIQLSFTANGMAVEYLTGAGVWTALVSAALTNINYVIAFETSNYSVRVRNNTGAAKNFTIIGTLLNNFLNITTTVTYQFNAIGYRPFLALKHYLSRIVGEYDNLSAPVFDTKWTIGNGAANADTAATGLYNPPPMNGADFLNFGGPRNVPTGNQYTGGNDNWIRSGITIFISNGNIRSNALLFRGQRLVSTPAYIPKSLITLNVTLSVAVNIARIRIYGNRGLNRELLETILAPIVGLNTKQFTTTRIYDGISIEVESVGVYSATITSIIISNTYNTVGDGKYSLNMLANGLNATDPGVFNDYLKFSLTCTLKDILKSLRNIFGLAIYPEINADTGLVKMVIGEIDDVFIPVVSPLQLRLQEFTITPDTELIYDTIKVGGQFSDDYDFYGDASSTESDYSSQYITTITVKDQSIPACLNTPLLVGGSLSKSDLIILNLVSFSNLTFPVYRLAENLTIVGSVSPLQPNWLFSEGRLMRNNTKTIFAGGTESYRLMYGKRANTVSVNFSGDSLGPIADADPILGNGVIDVWLINGTTEISLSELQTLINDIHKTFTTIINNQSTDVFVKNASYNFASGKLILTLWPKNIPT